MKMGGKSLKVENLYFLAYNWFAYQTNTVYIFLTKLIEFTLISDNNQSQGKSSILFGNHALVTLQIDFFLKMNESQNKYVSGMIYIDN